MQVPLPLWFRARRKRERVARKETPPAPSIIRYYSRRSMLPLSWTFLHHQELNRVTICSHSKWRVMRRSPGGSSSHLIILSFAQKSLKIEYLTRWFLKHQLQVCVLNSQFSNWLNRLRLWFRARLSQKVFLPHIELIYLLWNKVYTIKFATSWISAKNLQAQRNLISRKRPRESLCSSESKLSLRTKWVLKRKGKVSTIKKSLSQAITSSMKSPLGQWVRGQTMSFRQKCQNLSTNRPYLQVVLVQPWSSTSLRMWVTVLSPVKLNFPKITWLHTRRTLKTISWSAKATILALRQVALPTGKCSTAPQCSSKVKSRTSQSLGNRAHWEQHRSHPLRGWRCWSRRRVSEVVRTRKFVCKKSCLHSARWNLVETTLCPQRSDLRRLSHQTGESIQWKCHERSCLQTHSPQRWTRTSPVCRLQGPHANLQWRANSSQLSAQES